MNSFIDVKGVQRDFGQGNQTISVLKGINLSIDQHQMIALKGRSGSGKTTLLNLIGGLDQPTKGEIYVDGQQINTLSDRECSEYRRTNIGFIFQSHGLVPLMTVEENVEFSLRVAEIPREEWKTRVEEALELVGLTKRMKHLPLEISGGEQQRVAIARAIAVCPVLILADEPTAELDSKRSYQLINVLQELVQEKKTTIIMTTHDPAILEMLDHVYQLEDGRIEAV
ncbi:ABC transporter ATP-binding protein [Litchfieldia alkalitelluris]|uniref:ABC transporter ATP-binding protein n=1 Tax=Litchfieldia alkalitelluris TaxID=304268 RepID=UPI0009967FE8|nr:ABC transporter ATP-binding protein [Litchfieldia alkalitelluris]